MSADDKTPGGFSLRRWSRRKLEATREAAPCEAQLPASPVDVPSQNVPAAAPSGAPAMSTPAGEPTLAPVDSLTADSDFTAYLKPNVDESVKRLALKKLLTDPRFNVMDGLDVYIDDYTKTVPIPPDVLEQLMKANFSFNPPIALGEVPQAPVADPRIEMAPRAPAIADDSLTTAPGASAASPAPDSTLPLPDEADDPYGPPDTKDPTPSR